MCSAGSVPGLSLLDASRIPSVVTTPNLSKHSQMSPGGVRGGGELPWLTPTGSNFISNILEQLVLFSEAGMRRGTVRKGKILQ